MLGLLREHVENIILHLFLGSDIRDSNILFSVRTVFVEKDLKKYCIILTCFQAEVSAEVNSISLLN